MRWRDRLHQLARLGYTAITKNNFPTLIKYQRRGRHPDSILGGGLFTHRAGQAEVDHVNFRPHFLLKPIHDGFGYRASRSQWGKELYQGVGFLADAVLQIGHRLNLRRGAGPDIQMQKDKRPGKNYQDDYQNNL